VPMTAPQNMPQRIMMPPFLATCASGKDARRKMQTIVTD
jgi:hypothetical protein